MKRIIDWHLETWKKRPKRKPLLLRGARQTGKTYAVRQLGKHFESFVEVNFEFIPDAKNIFDKDLKPDRILLELSLLSQTNIEPGKTLLFLDEIQVAPNALTSLRYFYELIPDLHVIAAGSLLDFIIEEIGMPVGRISSLSVYPLSFMEFLSAAKQEKFIQAILNETSLSKVLHDNLLDLLATYLAIGGMPESVQAWVDTKDPRASYEVQNALIDAYRQDFPKYAKKHQIQYLELFLERIHHFIGKQFKYSSLHNEYKKRELEPCLNLLKKANVVHQITHSAGNGLPLGAEANLDKFKLIWLDVGLSQALLGLDLASWFLNPDKDLINRGAIIEAFIGQELLVYSSPTSKEDLYYWKRESRGSLAEVDYLYELKGEILPIEVKSGHGSTLRSMHQFLDEHRDVKQGLRFWAGGYEVNDKIRSKPLYAAATLAHQDQQEALLYLI